MTALVQTANKMGLQKHYITKQPTILNSRIEQEQTSLVLQPQLGLLTK
jgi:hypothetical protein